MYFFHQNERAQAYLFVSFLLAIFVAATVMSTRITKRENTMSDFEIKNLKNELPMAYTSGIYVNDVNTILVDSITKFINFFKGKGLTLKIIYIAYDKNNTYYLGNFFGRNCGYSNGVVSGSLNNGETIDINKETLLNDLNIIFCGYTMNMYDDDFKYVAMITRGSEVSR